MRKTQANGDERAEPAPPRWGGSAPARYAACSGQSSLRCGLVGALALPML